VTSSPQAHARYLPNRNFSVAHEPFLSNQNPKRQEEEN